MLAGLWLEYSRSRSPLAQRPGQQRSFHEELPNPPSIFSPRTHSVPSRGRSCQLSPLRVNISLHSLLWRAGDQYPGRTSLGDVIEIHLTMHTCMCIYAGERGTGKRGVPSLTQELGPLLLSPFTHFCALGSSSLDHHFNQTSSSHPPRSLIWAPVRFKKARKLEQNSPARPSTPSVSILNHALIYIPTSPP